jgi:asparagine synthase (glutamine-hydrolysing)
VVSQGGFLGEEDGITVCGIAGFTWRDEALALRMVRSLAHRGPDSQGTHDEEGVTLAHTRLSILDVSESGRQPMRTADGSVALVYNGEIYNYPDLRPELEAKGYQFRGHCDTEVILYAYQEWGLEAVHKLRGMFAFALWDRSRKRLWLVRDRLGIKPLYYHAGTEGLIFGSEIKALLQEPRVPRRVNWQALYDYLGFEFVPAPATMFSGIQKLPAGHQLIWKNGRADLSAYWDLSFQPRDLGSATMADAVGEVRETLSDCVKSHLLSDVPLGVFLSGGLDSSALVAFMRRHISGPLRTFTIGYPDKTFSELDSAELVARHFGTEHHVLMVEGVTPDTIEKSVYHLDEPMTDLSAIPLMLACAKARVEVKVCLSGEGGDEVFAGYDRFKASRLNRHYALIPGAVRRQVIGRLVRALPDQAQKKGPINLLKRFVEGADLDAEGMHLRWQYFLNRTLCTRLFSPAFREQVDLDPFRTVREYNASCRTTDVLNRELYLDTRFMMPDSVLMKVDKMSMAHSLEVRVPMLDHRFVELNAGLPGAWKLKGLETKHLFRKALTGVLPDRIVWREKQGYSLPIKNLLRGHLREYMRGLLNESPLIRDLMNLEHVNRLIAEHLEQRHNHNHVLWGLMTTALWHRRFIESPD